MAPLQNASSFLIYTLFDLYLFVLILRFIFQYLRVDYYNPVTQFIVKATNPLIVPLRRAIPGMWGIDFATLVAIFILSLIKLTLIMIVTSHKLPFLPGLILWSLGDITSLIVKLFFYAILTNVIMSWLAPTSRSPVTSILYTLTEPFMRPARRMLPPISGFDLSPIVVMVVLQLVIILLAEPLTQAGFHFALQ